MISLHKIQHLIIFFGTNKKKKQQQTNRSVDRYILKYMYLLSVIRTFPVNGIHFCCNNPASELSFLQISWSEDKLLRKTTSNILI